MKKSIESFIIFLTTVVFSIYNSVLAQDTFKSVKIGSQTWMLENLNVSTFRNGDSIPEVKTKEEWTKTGEEGKPAWCYYENDSENGKKYGKLYNWYAVNDKRGLAPEGWHISSKAEFEILSATVNQNSNALKVIGQGTGKGVGTNTSGFSGLFAGDRFINSEFGTLGGYANFWSSTEYNVTNAYDLYIFGDDSKIYFGNLSKAYGFSVRCLKD